MKGYKNCLRNLPLRQSRILISNVGLISVEDDPRSGRLKNTTVLEGAQVF